MQQSSKQLKNKQKTTKTNIYIPTMNILFNIFKIYSLKNLCNSKLQSTNYPFMI